MLEQRAKRKGIDNRPSRLWPDKELHGSISNLIQTEALFMHNNQIYEDEIVLMSGSFAARQQC